MTLNGLQRSQRNRQKLIKFTEKQSKQKKRCIFLALGAVGIRLVTNVFLSSKINLSGGRLEV